MIDITCVHVVWCITVCGLRDLQIGNLPKWVRSLMISKLNILINPCTNNNKLLGIVEARVES